MNISLESYPDINEIISYDDTSIVIRNIQNDVIRLDKNLILTPKHIITDRCISIDDQDDVDYLISLEPEVLILAQNSRRQIPPKILIQFTSQAIGLETMSFGSTCRTYNLLAAEGRQVMIVVGFS